MNIYKHVFVCLLEKRVLAMWRTKCVVEYDPKISIMMFCVNLTRIFMLKENEMPTIFFFQYYQLYAIRHSKTHGIKPMTLPLKDHDLLFFAHFCLNIKENSCKRICRSNSKIL